MATIITLTGIDFVGDGCDLIYLDDEHVTSGDGDFEYTSGFEAGLQCALPEATVQVVTLHTTSEDGYVDGEEPSVWFANQDTSSLASLLIAAKEHPSINVTISAAS